MRRRDFIKGIVGSATAWPVAARAQQGERVRLVGFLEGISADTPSAKERYAAFLEGLQQLGWTPGRNVRLEARWNEGAATQKHAAELVALAPEVILAESTPVTAALQRQTRTIPIVFVAVSDPIGSGFVANLARPGGNITGLLYYEASISGKWLAILKEIAPRLTRAALMANPKTTPYYYFLRGAEAAASSLAIELVSSPIETAADIESVIESIARVPNGGLVLPPDATTIIHRDLIIDLAARYRLPAVYALRDFVVAGGLMAYSSDIIEQNREAASYVDQILRGANPAELPVQAPTKFKTFVNLKTARTLGLDVPSLMLVRADEVIE